MKTITIKDLRSKGSAAIAEDRPTFLIVNSKIKSVLISPEEYELFLDAVEELEDIRDYELRKNEPTIPADQVWKELGIEKEMKEIENKLMKKNV